MLSTLLFSFIVATDTIQPPVVVVVRHAEKEAEPRRDPGLTDAGRARAAALDSMLVDANVTAILVTPFRRNRETAEFVAKRHGITPLVVQINEGLEAYSAEVADVARRAGGTVLVVGNSNTLDDVVNALGGNGSFGDLCENQYQSVWYVIPGEGSTRTIRSRFGAGDQPAPASCTTMK
jgi:phosphohistidine phosphatase SixA